MTKKRSKPSRYAEPISLHPLSLEDALRSAAATGSVTETEERNPAVDQVRRATRKSVQKSRRKKQRLTVEPPPES
jgi:hypothetical protein